MTYPQNAPGTTVAAIPAEPPKSRTTALLMCLFFGPLGGHRFYVGKTGSAFATIFTVGGFLTIWPFIDLIRILTGSFTDKYGRPLVR